MLNMFDSFGDGWDSAYYNVLSQDGKLLYGGNLPPQGEKESSNELCLKKDQCSIIMLESLGIIDFHSFLILFYHPHPSICLLFFFSSLLLNLYTLSLSFLLTGTLYHFLLYY